MLEKYNVVWDTPSENCYGSMPLGNGDIGLNLWVQQDGGLYFYISKTDAWSETARLLKLGRVRVGITPSPFKKGMHFKQTLNLKTAEILIEVNQIKMRVWVDANNPVIHVVMEGAEDFEVRMDVELWRTSRRYITDTIELESAYHLSGPNPNPIVIEPDTVVPDQKDRVVWYHRNPSSIWKDNLELQDLEEFIPKLKDPLINRTFGAIVQGEGLVTAGELSLASKKADKKFSIDFHVLTTQTDTPDEWIGKVEKGMAKINAIPKKTRYDDHCQWWEAFWNRSWIYVTESWDSFGVTQGYTLQRFINACGGRGEQPIKFNGSIFTVDGWPSRPMTDGSIPDADYRCWGGAFYWFQNTRLIYWSLLASGDFDLMQPFFKMFYDALPIGKHRARNMYNTDGAVFGEVISFWGTFTNNWYNFKSKDEREKLKDRFGLTLYQQGAIELSAMMLDYFEITQDEKFAAEMMLPLVSEVMIFFDQHWGRDENGKIRFDPSVGLETWAKTVNPMPEVAGLKWVLTKLLELPIELTTEAQRTGWSKTLNDLPEIPTRELLGMKMLSPAQEFANYANSENVELYAIFPYRLFGVDKPDLEMATLTFAHRFRQVTGGWQQDAIQAAYLGNATSASQDVERNFLTKDPHSRFPAFWGPNFDYVPDQDHGTVASTALQRMLMHTEGKKIILFPAWPHFWSVHFKLHAPYNTTVEGIYENRELKELKVSPEDRAKDVVIIEPRHM
ncbi:MAG: DUF5703 domain-containing protein [bacterium]